MVIKRSIELRPERISVRHLEELERRGLIMRPAPTEELLSAPEGRCRVIDLYVSEPRSGPHKLIAVGCNRSNIPLGVHNENEEFLVFSGAGGRRQVMDYKPLYLVVALWSAQELQKRSENGQLVPDDFLMLELVFDDPELSFFTMLHGTVHTEITTPGKGKPPIFYVTESQNISMEIVSLPSHDLVPVFPETSVKEKATINKLSFYAPYYNEEFQKYLAPGDAANSWLESWCKAPTPQGTGNITVAEYTPVSRLELSEAELKPLDYGIIDAHNHLDGYSPQALLEIMAEAGVERIMNLSVHRRRDDFLEEYDRLKKAMGDRLLAGAPLLWQEVSREGAVEEFRDQLKLYRERGVCALKVYKVFGLVLRDEYGDKRLLRLDDERFAPLWELCGKLAMPVIIHQGDPEAFFHPLDAKNERLEELGAHPDWHFFDPDGRYPSRKDLLTRLERVMNRHPDTIFICVHVGNDPENLGNVSRMLSEHPNMWVDISARAAELGRQPNTARKFFLRHADRIIFGSDLPPHVEMYRRYCRFLETDDDNFMYPTHVSGQGNWRISGIYLPKEILRKVYRENIVRILSGDHKRLIAQNQSVREKWLEGGGSLWSGGGLLWNCPKR